MRNVNLINILIVGMTLGTAWAIRGHFGHEQGAAWAGGIAALALVLVSKRKDWYKKMLLIVLGASVGWGVTGMISYGRIVGYGMSDNYPNALYGLTMLFVIGALFGLLGGGLTALSLESSKIKKVEWGSLLTQLTVGGLIVYGLLVNQLEWLMTPPRSEAWAICFGAALALHWYAARNGFSSTIRVSLITGVGTGFGFAFGNFLQIIGIVAEIPFNMWNVMEYSIGFFGGISLAYSVFTSKWPQAGSEVKIWENKAAFILVFLFIPFVVFQQSFSFKPIIERFTSYQTFTNAESVAKISTILSLVILTLMAVGVGYNIKRTRNGFNEKNIRFAFIAYFSAYTVLGYIINGVVGGKTELNIHLYVVNIILILVLLRVQRNPFSPHLTSRINSVKFVKVLVVVILILLIMSLVSINLHERLPGTENRFMVSTNNY